MTRDIQRNGPGMLGQVTQDELDHAALVAAGFDRVPRPTQIVVMEMARRYGLELPLRHVVAIKGKPYITRDGLLHVAHRSGQLDGIELEEQGGNTKDGWWARVRVYRKDMSRSFSYPGRYRGENKTFGPEMAIKCSESMTLRRAFNVALCSAEERWDVDQRAPAPTPEPRIVPRRIDHGPERKMLGAPNCPAQPDPEPVSLQSVATALALASTVPEGPAIVGLPAGIVAIVGRSLNDTGSEADSDTKRAIWRWAGDLGTASEIVPAAAAQHSEEWVAGQPITLGHAAAIIAQLWIQFGDISPQRLAWVTEQLAVASGGSQ